MMRSRCPHCNAEIQVLAERAGQVMTCVSCGTDVTIPDDARSAATMQLEATAPGGGGNVLFGDGRVEVIAL